MVIQVGTEPDRAKARRKRQGQTIRKLRELRGLSTDDLADALTVTTGAVSHWETGRYSPRLPLQVAIARALNVPHSVIFGVDSEAAS